MSLLEWYATTYHSLVVTDSVTNNYYSEPVTMPYKVISLHAYLI